MFNYGETNVKILLCSFETPRPKTIDQTKVSSCSITNTVCY